MKADENTTGPTLNQRQHTDSLRIPSPTLSTIINNSDSIIGTATSGGCKHRKVKYGGTRIWGILLLTGLITIEVHVYP